MTRSLEKNEIVKTTGKDVRNRESNATLSVIAFLWPFALMFLGFLGPAMQLVLFIVGIILGIIGIVKKNAFAAVMLIGFSIFFIVYVVN